MIASSKARRGESLDLVRRLAVLGLMGLVAAGCNTGSRGGSSGVAGSGSTGAGSVTPTAGAPTIVSATLTDADNNGAVSLGDTITIVCSEEVQVGTGVDPNSEFRTPVSGNSFGQGASVALGQQPIQLVVTLGANPSLRVSGTFAPQNLVSGDPSGIDFTLTATLNITDLQGTPASASAVLDLDGPFVEGFNPAGTMNTPRGLHTATLLDDGRVLVVGGIDSSSGNPAFAVENEIFDPATGTWTNTSDPSLGGNPGGLMTAPATINGQQQLIPVPRVFHSATKLANGLVLITGGLGFERVDASGQPIQETLVTAHIFDPTTNQFGLLLSTMSLPRQDHYSVALSNGNVVIAGGSTRATAAGQPGLSVPAAEIFNIQTGAFAPLSQTGNDMTKPRQNGCAAPIQGGSKAVFISGVAVAIDPQTNQPALFIADGTDEFDSANNVFLNGATPLQDRRYMGSTTLPNGDVAMAGGDLGSASIFGTVEVLDVAAGLFRTPGSLNTARSRCGAAPIGSQLLVVGGTDMSGTVGSNEFADGEIMDLTTGQITGTFQMAAARNSHTVTQLLDGRVLVVGGFNGGTDALSLDGQPVAEAEAFARQ